MFDKKDKIVGQNDVKTIKASMSGEIISLYNVADDAFSDKMIGDGIAIIPENGNIYAPVDGVVEHIPETLHAICIRTYDDINILVHIGIDTVEMLGLGLNYFVNVGDKIKCGELIGEANLEIISERGYDTCIPLVIDI